MSGLSTRLPFWLCMVGAQIGAFVIFKDLADISQWLVQSSREFTMAVWYHRHLLTFSAVALLLASTWFWWRDRRVCPKPVFVLLVLLFAANVYSGMFNTILMFRPQQQGARFVPVEEAPRYLQRSLDHARYGDEKYASVDEINMIVLETDAGARAYSDYYLLQPHVADGGSVDGAPAVMTYCGLTNLGIAYSPRIDGQPLELRAITQLQNNLVLADANTGESIQQLWGHLERAPQRGAMREFATVRMPFRSFRVLYPDGEVFVNEIASVTENPILAAWDTLVRHGMMLWGVGLQWRSPDKPAFPTVPDPDPRLPLKERVYALNVGDDYVTYTKAFIIEHGPTLNVRIGDRAVVIDYEPDYDLIAAYFNPTDAPIAEVDAHGRTPSGIRLERVNTLKSDLFWFIFAAYYPQTDVNRI